MQNKAHGMVAGRGRTAVLRGLLLSAMAWTGCSDAGNDAGTGSMQQGDMAGQPPGQPTGQQTGKQPSIDPGRGAAASQTGTAWGPEAGQTPGGGPAAGPAEPVPGQMGMGDMVPVAGGGGQQTPPTMDPMDPMIGDMAGDMAGNMDVDMTPDPEPEPVREDLGEGDGSDVITIGDSWMNSFTAGIQISLVRAAGQPYRTYGVGGTRLLSGQIPGQYTMAKRENPDIKTVVMTGGGNDIIQVPGLRDDCDAGGDLCGEEVGKILDGLSELWAEMAADGVQDVVYVAYSDPDNNDIDFDLPDGDSVTARCEAVPEPLRCHRLAAAPLIPDGISGDGIHPTSASYDILGQAVYDLMIEEGMRR